jgi:hypothetical protein
MNTSVIQKHVTNMNMLTPPAYWHTDIYMTFRDACLWCYIQSYTAQWDRGIQSISCEGFNMKSGLLTHITCINTMSKKPFCHYFLWSPLQDLAISQNPRHQLETAQWDAWHQGSD